MEERCANEAKVGQTTVILVIRYYFNRKVAIHEKLNRCCVALGITRKLKVLVIKCLSS